MTPKRLAVHIKPQIEKRMYEGHPWLFDQAITKQSDTGNAGDFAVIYNRHNKFLGIGLYDPSSPIRVKMLHVGKPVTIDEAWFHERLTQVVAKRAPLAQTNTTGYRLVHGENDGFPSLIVDRYADTLVIKLYSPIWLPQLPIILPILEALVPCERMILRLSRNLQAQSKHGYHDGQALKGMLPNAPIAFQENGLTFTADVVKGHKTGFFFDQRDNRYKVYERAKGRTVLDVFAYVGAFSVYSAWGGAKSVTSLDISAQALELAQHHFELNKAVTQKTQHEVLAEDAFEGLIRLHRQRTRYDMLIIDPPNFANAQHEVDGALNSYYELARLGVALLEPRGVFVMASCTSRVTSDAFFKTVHDGVSDAGKRLYEQERTSHAIDHPIGFAEGAYLKCIFGSVS